MFGRRGPPRSRPRYPTSHGLSNWDGARFAMRRQAPDSVLYVPIIGPARPARRAVRFALGANMGAGDASLAPVIKLGEALKEGVPVADAATTEAERKKQKKQVEERALNAVLVVVTHTRDCVFLVLGASLLHVGVNVHASDQDAPIAQCLFLLPGFLAVIAFLLTATLAMLVARYFCYDNLVVNTLLDVSLVFLGAALQLAVKPHGWTSSADQAFCSITANTVGPVPLLAWLCGEGLSFLSAARSFADYTSRPPFGAPAWIVAVIFLVLGIASFPLVDLLIAPVLRDTIVAMNLTTSA